MYFNHLGTHSTLCASKSHLISTSNRSLYSYSESSRTDDSQHHGLPLEHVHFVAKAPYVESRCGSGPS